MSLEAGIVRTWTLALVVLCCAGLCDAQSEPAETARVTVRVVPDARTTALVRRALAEIAEPPRAVIGKGSTPEDYLLQQYGFYSEALWAAFAELNADDVELVDPTTPFEDVTVVRLPLFPKQERNALVTVGEAESFEEIVTRETGFFGDKTLAAVRELNPKLDAKNLSAGSQFRLPYAAVYTSYDLQANVTYEEANRRLDALEDELREIERRDFLLDSIVVVDRVIDDAPDTTTGEEPDQSWRLSVDEQETILKLLRESNVRFPAVVAAIATGISSPVDPRFERVFWRNLPESIGVRGVDDDANGYIDDAIGLNVASPIQTPIEDAETSYGTHVAGLLTGRLVENELRQEIDERLRLMVVKITDFSGVASYTTLAEGIRYADDQGVSIMYLGFGGDCEGFEPSRRDLADPAYASRLVVVPAGNDARDLSETCPARLSLEPNTISHVISVAAHDFGGFLTPFSNYEADIAAPGVAVLSTVLSGNAAQSGTSQSAAIVAFASALLASMGMTEAVDIKARIVAAADYRPELEGRIKSSGVLNVAKALSFRQDLVETDKGVFRGTIRTPERIEHADLGSVSLSGIGKIARRPDGSYRVTMFDPNVRELTHLTLELNLGKIEIVGVDPNGNQGSFVLAPDEVLDIVPRTRPTIMRKRR